MEDQRPGAVAWADLTVPDAERVRDFYREVVGWQPSPVDMGGYDDFNMNLPGTDVPAAGVCHARGGNADLPPQWLIYVVVTDLAASAAAVERLGGAVLRRSRRHCLIKDPAGAVMMIYQPNAT
jgi:predicted enzyme related to lactoylglutathione lyase